MQAEFTKEDKEFSLIVLKKLLILCMKFIEKSFIFHQIKGIIHIAGLFLEVDTNIKISLIFKFYKFEKMGKFFCCSGIKINFVTKSVQFVNELDQMNIVIYYDS